MILNIFPACHFLSDSGRATVPAGVYFAAFTWKFHLGLFFFHLFDYSVL